MAARGKAEGNGVDLKDLLDQFREAVLHRMEALEKTVGELAKAMNAGQVSLPREFMRREDCAAFHEGLDKRLAIWIDHFQTQIKNLQATKADKDTLTTGISTAKVAFGIFVWIIATMISIAGTIIGFAVFIGNK